jgi:hypothetical protein
MSPTLYLTWDAVPVTYAVDWCALLLGLMRWTFPKRHLFRQEGIFQTQPAAFVQPAGDFVESIHSRNGFSRQRMGAESAEAFDHKFGNLLSPYLQKGWLTLGVIGYVVWGRPETL